MDVGELSKMLGYSRNTIYRLVNTDKIPHHRLSGRTIRFYHHEIVEWLEATKQGPKSAKMKDGGGANGKGTA